MGRFLTSIRQLRYQDLARDMLINVNPRRSLQNTPERHAKGPPRAPVGLLGKLSELPGVAKESPTGPQEPSVWGHSATVAQFPQPVARFLRTTAQFLRPTAQFLRTTAQFLRTLAQFLRTMGQFLSGSGTIFIDFEGFQTICWIFWLSR